MATTEGGFWSWLREAGVSWYEDNAARMSSSLAYYTLLSLAPMLLLAVSIAGFFMDSVDAEQVFVGSFNLDPRSVSLNCEQGVLVSDAALAARVEALFAGIKTGDHAWRVTHDPQGKLRWSDGQDTHTSEPQASLARRVLARAVGYLPIESQL